MANLHFIKEHGIKQFIEQQKKRIRLLETMIDDFDDGRSRSFFCRAAALLSLNSLGSSLDKATQKIKTDNIAPNDIKIKARILKGLLNEAGFKEGIELKPRKNP